MAEWQTRCVQVAVLSRGWRFKSSRRHHFFSSLRAFFCPLSSSSTPFANRLFIDEGFVCPHPRTEITARMLCALEMRKAAPPLRQGPQLRLSTGRTRPPLRQGPAMLGHERYCPKKGPLTLCGASGPGESLHCGCAVLRDGTTVVRVCCYARARFCQADLPSSSAREAAEAPARASASYRAKLRLSVMARLSVSGMASASALDPDGLNVAITL